MQSLCLRRILLYLFTCFYAKLKFQTAFSPLTWFPEV